VHAELVQALGDADLVGEGEVDALALGSVAERRVVDFDLLCLHVLCLRCCRQCRSGKTKNPVPAAERGFRENSFNAAERGE
jgi:hypothetical protein